MLNVPRTQPSERYTVTKVRSVQGKLLLRLKPRAKLIMRVKASTVSHIASAFATISMCR